jgi:hypothetical protein
MELKRAVFTRFPPPYGKENTYQLNLYYIDVHRFGLFLLPNNTIFTI